MFIVVVLKFEIFEWKSEKHRTYHLTHYRILRKQRDHHFQLRILALQPTIVLYEVNVWQMNRAVFVQVRLPDYQQMCTQICVNCACRLETGITETFFIYWMKLCTLNFENGGFSRSSSGRYIWQKYDNSVVKHLGFQCIIAYKKGLQNRA